MTGVDGPAGLGSAPDATLLQWARAGSSDAYFELWLRHEEFADRVAHGLARSSHDRSDLVAMTRDSIWRALSNGHGPSVAFRAYLTVAMRNLAARRYARADDLTAELDQLTKPDGQLSEQAFARVELGEVMRRAFAMLSDRHREVLLLSEVDQLPPSEVGRHFGISANAASQLAVRARQALRYAWIDAHMADRPLTTPECTQHRCTVRRVVAGDASPDEIAALDHHIRSCEPCREAYLTAGDAGFVRRAVAVLLLGPAAPGLAPHRQGPVRHTRHLRAARGAAVAGAAGAAAVALWALAPEPSERTVDAGAPSSTHLVEVPPATAEPAPPTSTTSSAVAQIGPPAAAPTSVTTLPGGTTASTATSTTVTSTTTTSPPATTTTLPPSGPSGWDRGTFARLEIVHGRWGLASGAATVTWPSPGCEQTAPGVATLSVAVPARATRTRQLLSWAGSGAPSLDVSVNGVAVPAARITVDRVEVALLGRELQFWQASTETDRAPDDTYALTGLDLRPEPGHCATGTAFGGASILVLYEDPTLPERLLTIATGLVPIHRDLDTTAWMAPAEAAGPGEALLLGYEGDDDLTGGEALLVDGEPVGPTDDIHRSRDEAGASTPGVGISRFSLRERARRLEVTSGQDFVLAAALVVTAG